MNITSKLKSILLFGFLMLSIFLAQNYCITHILRDQRESVKPAPSTTSIYEWTPYGSAVASGYTAGEHDYLEWNISTLYGPGFTWYMMNDSEYWYLAFLRYDWRTRENLSYTVLLSDEEESASGTFYPQYADLWWLVSINHYTGHSCSVAFTIYWKEDFITVLEPNSSTSFEEDMINYINWTWGGDFASVDIDLYYNETFLFNIATQAYNNGSYSWIPPHGLLADEGLYQINITDSAYPLTWGISEPYFDIIKRSIDVTNPELFSAWECGFTWPVTWDFTGAISNVKIDLYKDGIHALDISPTTPNDGTFFWNIPLGLINSSNYQIKISDMANSSIHAFSDYFTIYTINHSSPLPIIHVTDPSASSSWECGTTHSIYWDVTGNISAIKIDLYKDDVHAMVIISETPNDGSFSWNLPSGLTNSTNYQIKVSEASNSSRYDFSDYFEIYDSMHPPTQPVISGYNLIVLYCSLIAAAFMIASRKQSIDI
jgi:hypothetical protein